MQGYHPASDISKDRLDAFRLSDRQRQRLRKRQGRVQGPAEVDPAAPRTAHRLRADRGPNHRGMEAALAECEGHALVKVNPRQARRFAEATGTQAKTGPGGCRCCWRGWVWRSTCRRAQFVANS